MRWPLGFFRSKRAPALPVRADPVQDSDEDEDDRLDTLVTPPVLPQDQDSSQKTHSKRRSLDVWHEAHKARSSFDLHSSQRNQTRMTGRLSVELSNGTAIINRTYAVLKTLGTGTFGKVRLVLNIQDYGLFALKSCSKLQIMQSMQRQLGKRNRSCDIRRSVDRRSSNVANAFNKAHLLPPSDAYRQARQQLAECSQRCQSAGSPGNSGVHSEDLLREIAILKRLDHPNVVRLNEVIDDPHTDSLLLVMEYVDGGTLEQPSVAFQKWETVPEVKIRNWVREILQGLDYLHSNQVIHGDLKPANLLISSSGRVKLGDFGSAVLFSEVSPFGSASFGTPAFRAPETLNAGYKLGRELDVWALGVCIYIWAFGCLPFDGCSAFAMYESIRAKSVQLPQPCNFSMGLQDLLHRMLEKDPLHRISVQEALGHPWVTVDGTCPIASVSAASEGSIAANLTRLDFERAIQKTATHDSVWLHLMDQVFREVTYKRGQALFREGEEINTIFLLAEGSLVTMADTGGNPTVADMVMDDASASSPTRGCSSMDRQMEALEFGSRALNRTISTLSNLSLSSDLAAAAVAPQKRACRFGAHPMDRSSPTTSVDSGDLVSSSFTDGHCKDASSPRVNAAHLLSVSRMKNFNKPSDVCSTRPSALTHANLAMSGLDGGSMSSFSGSFTSLCLEESISTHVQRTPQRHVAGDVLGLASMFETCQGNDADATALHDGRCAGKTPTVRWPCSGYALSDVVAICANVDDVRRLYNSHPEVQDRILSLRCQQENQRLVTEAIQLLQLEA